MLTYSIINKKNYLNMDNDAFEWILTAKNASQYE